ETAARRMRQQIQPGRCFPPGRRRDLRPVRHRCVPRLADDASKDESKGHTGQTVLFVLLGIGVAGLLSFFLFKYWQKKKREEQHARLLKLFEEDDDIEVELGLRD
uniref:Uncharacterized protein n=1 Tax=Aegilops tauschii subsp. strangulata TaxID=200361 RepID=A0A452Z5D3_AEGTS